MNEFNFRHRWANKLGETKKYEILEDLFIHDFSNSGTFCKISGVLSKMLAQINRTFSRVQKPGGNASRCRSWYVCGLPFSKFCSNAVFWAGFASYSSWTSQFSWRGSLQLRRYIGISVYHITTMPVQAKSNCKNIKRSIKRSKYVCKYSWKKLKLKENAEPSTCVHVKLIEV